jgi:hypothetical protein
MKTWLPVGVFLSGVLLLNSVANADMVWNMEHPDFSKIKTLVAPYKVVQFQDFSDSSTAATYHTMDLDRVKGRDKVYSALIDRNLIRGKYGVVLVEAYLPKDTCTPSNAFIYEVVTVEYQSIKTGALCSESPDGHYVTKLHYPVSQEGHEFIVDAFKTHEIVTVQFKNGSYTFFETAGFDTQLSRLESAL